MTGAELVPALAFLSVVYFIGSLVAVAKRQELIDPSDGLFVIVFMVVITLVLIVLSAKYNMLTYTWLGAGILAAMLAYGALTAPKAEFS